METLSDRGQGRARGWGRDLNCWAPRTGPGARKRAGVVLTCQRSRCGEGGASGCPGPAKAGVDTINATSFVSLCIWIPVWCGGLSGVVWTGLPSSSEALGFQDNRRWEVANCWCLAGQAAQSRGVTPTPDRHHRHSFFPLFLFDLFARARCPIESIVHSVSS